MKRTAVASMLLIPYWVGLTVWIAAVGSAGVAAMAVFGTLAGDTMPLRLDDYAAYPEAEHARILAGLVMDRVFAVIDRAQVVCAAVVLVTLILQLVSRRGWVRRPISNSVRTIAIVAATVIVTVHTLAIAPPMNAELASFRTAAAAGDTVRAAEHRTAFNQLHPIAEGLLRADLALLLVAVTASAMALRPDTKDSP